MYMQNRSAWQRPAVTVSSYSSAGAFIGYSSILLTEVTLTTYGKHDSHLYISTATHQGNL